MSAPLCQVALSVADLPLSYQWYRDVFGFMPASGTNAFKGFFASRVQGIPNVASTCWWLMDGQEFFQLELFQFHRPEARPLRTDWRASDIGYSTVGIHVREMDAVLARLATQGVIPLSPPMGENGARRACVRDPQGVLLELMEADPLGGSRKGVECADATVVSVTLSVADLDRSVAFFCDVLDLERSGVQLHEPEHEALWNLAAGSSRRCTLLAGQLMVELAEYEQGRPRADDYRISDLGILNIALGYRSRRDFNRAYRKCLDAGVRGNWRPLDLGAWKVVYVNDPQGFSVELLHVQPWYDRRMGFTAGIEPPPVRA